jgi:uncharacterized protein YjbI with pentapeptide repeats
VHQLTQSQIDRQDIALLKDWIKAKETIDASNLEISAGQLAMIHPLLPRNASGRHVFTNWRFTGTSFLDGSDFSSCHFSGCNFDDCDFGNDVSFSEATFSRSRFRRASFGDDTSFERVDFGLTADFHSATFRARARFSHSRFGSAQFFASTFGMEAAFSNARFESKARFHNARFGPRGGFIETHFAGACDFGGAYFGEKVQMAKAHFGAGPSFVGATFDPRARLTEWRVANDLDMRSAHFLGPVSLHGAQIGDNAIFASANFEGSVDVGDLSCGDSAYFDNATVSTADRFGPVRAAKRISLHSLIVRSPCAFQLSARKIDLSDSRCFAPLHITFSGGDLMMDRLQNHSRLILTAPQPVGAKFSRPRLISARGADLSSVVISGLDVRPLRLAGAEGIDGLRIDSAVSFEPAPRGVRAYREVIAEEHSLRAAKRRRGGWNPSSTQPATPYAPRVDMAELARIYRGLRKAREDSRDAPGAADFYYGEMEMRRLEARGRLANWNGLGAWAVGCGTYLLLELYRLFGGYGVRPSRPLLLFALLIGLASAIMDCGDLIQYVTPGNGPAGATLTPANFEQCVVFVLRSALLLPTSTSVTASTGAEWIQIAARIVGPLLVGLFAFGIRARVHR